MDISSYDRRNNPDYERLLRWDVKHKNIYQETITISETQQLPAIVLQCQ